MWARGGRWVCPPEVIRRPITRLAYWIGIRRWPSCTNTIAAITPSARNGAISASSESTRVPSKSKTAIARRLTISGKTVSNHISASFAKLQVADRSEAIVRARQAGLGGNAPRTGASANVVVAGIAARNGTPIGFWQFTRYGLVVAGATLLVATLYVGLRYFVVAG